MDLKEQKYVCTLAECKSLTRASERLYISQPALSLYINNVEKILGARLFERNGRKFELTWLGKQYVEKASQMLELERQFEAVRQQTERENAGRCGSASHSGAASGFCRRYCRCTSGSGRRWMWSSGKEIWPI